MKLKNKTDVIIIGLGAMGSASSLFLAEKGINVIGFDTYRPPHKFGSSHGHTRVIREAYHEGTSYVPIVQRAYKLWSDLNKKSKNQLLLEYGGLILGNNGDHIEKANASAAKYKIPITKFSKNEIIEKFSILNPPDDFLGLYEHRSGAVFPDKSLEFILSEATKLGSVHNYDENIINWKKIDNYYQVTTSKGQYFSEKLIFSSGAWIKNLLPKLNLPIKIERQVLFWFDPKKNREKFEYKFMPNTGWDLDNGLEFYTQPNIENYGFKVAMHHNGNFIKSENLNRQSNIEDLTTIRNFLEEFIPDANGELLNSTVGVYTDTPDLDFIIDFYLNDENIIICSPCSGHGFKFTPAIGEICSNLVVDKSSKFDLSEFSVNRFIE
ncbi:MAG: N-methyl-L-tryptophan oxidase [Dehalococcoidales bacterium]|nr:N-methyl-L-tryptophan oxidase [Dehalococcoidales bacterium]